MTMDVRDMKTFSDNTFDVVVDKGLLDVLACYEGEVGSNDSVTSTAKMVKEVHRVLKPRGRYLNISGLDSEKVSEAMCADSSCWSSSKGANFLIRTVWWVSLTSSVQGL